MAYGDGQVVLGRQGLRLHHARRGWPGSVRPLLAASSATAIARCAEGAKVTYDEENGREGPQGRQRPEDLAGGGATCRAPPPQPPDRLVVFNAGMIQHLPRGRSRSAALFARRAAASAQIVEVGASTATATPPAARRAPAWRSRAPRASRPSSGAKRSVRRARATGGSSPGRSRSARPAASRSAFFEDNLGGAAPAGITCCSSRQDAVFGRVHRPEPGRAAHSRTSARRSSSRSTTSLPVDEGLRRRADRADLGAGARARPAAATASGARAAPGDAATTPNAERADRRCARSPATTASTARRG